MVIRAFLVAGILVIPVVISAQPTVDRVMEAYTLRTAGQADSAKTILEEILAYDSTHAMANFEMARLLEATSPMQSEVILGYYSRAVAADPQNTHFRFARARSLLLKAYIAMHGDDTEAGREAIRETCQAFGDVLEKDPACTEALLYLTDIYATLPVELGGDSAKAKYHATMLEQINRFAGAQGEVIMAGEEFDEAAFWEGYLSENGEDPRAMERQGRALLMKDDIAGAEQCFDKVIKSDPTKQILQLDLARGYIYRVMRDTSDNEANLGQAKAYLLAYLDSPVEKPVGVQAWSYGLLSRIEMFLGNKEASEEALQHARELDPNFSRAMAVPSVDDPPDALTYRYGSFFRPF
jgi:tetratricopeptide (TPR) repeat protein